MSNPLKSTLMSLLALALVVPAGVVYGEESSGFLKITCPEEGGEVSLNGKLKGDCPIDVEVPDGRYKIVIRSDREDGSYRYFERSLYVGGGTVQKVEAERFETRYTEAYYWQKKDYKALVKYFPDSPHVAEAQSALGRQAAEEERLATAEREEKARRDREDAEARSASRERKAAERNRRLQVIDSLWKDMAAVKGGCYRMGDVFGDGAPDELPAHEACVSDFRIGKHEVTNAQYAAVMGDLPSGFTCLECPASMSWDEAQAFVSRLNTRTGGSYRLPTEAEWEYAARSGGKGEKFPGGVGESEVDNVAVFVRNSVVTRSILPLHLFLPKEAWLKTAGVPEGSARGRTLVVGIPPNSPAAQQLAVDDVIAAIDGVALESAGDLPRIVRATPPGRMLTLTVYRGGKSFEASVAPIAGSLREPAPVGGKKPNGLGLYDMAGNVSEWVGDLYDFKEGTFRNDTYYKDAPRQDPTGPAKGGFRIVRGGGCDDVPFHLRASARKHYPSNLLDACVGVRLAVPSGGKEPVPTLLPEDSRLSKAAAERLGKLNRMLEAGLITRAEFDKAHDDLQP